MKKLYMVSLGPGDYELVTIKALKALQNSDVICIPTKSKDNSFDKSITYNIVQALFDEFGFSKPLVAVYTPMKFLEKDWLNQVDTIMTQFSSYDKVSFVTLGDSAVYSTVYYLLDYIKEQNIDIYTDSEIIAGVTSFSSASAKIKRPLVLGDSKLTITPLVENELKETTIYMRPKRGMDTSPIPSNGDTYTFENLHLKDEKISNSKIDEVSKYMTLFIDFYR
jgi:precorrin-2/cobalt-factor-2 C20-methyltransferase